ncbi:hypothetical protein [Pseudomonas sp. NPDC007930]|uniref:hypothetical protein n=1 Tax=Pseudomonas sp. NPDC007930 TaxID=3364417 RepID=UPI0036E14398
MKKPFFIFAALSLAGCANMPAGSGSGLNVINSLTGQPAQTQPFDPVALNRSVVPGKTTPDQVLTALGAPTTRQTSATGEETWQYLRDTGSASNSGTLSNLTNSLPTQTRARVNSSINQNTAQGGYASDLLELANSAMKGSGNSNAGPRNVTIRFSKGVVKDFSYQ